MKMKHSIGNFFSLLILFLLLLSSKTISGQCVMSVSSSNVNCKGESTGSATVTVNGLPGASCTTTAPGSLSCSSCTKNLTGSSVVDLGAGEKGCIQVGATFTGIINLNGGTLVICGGGQPSNLNFNQGNVYVLSSGTLRINNLTVNPTCGLFNYGTVDVDNLTGSNGILENHKNFIIRQGYNVNSGSTLLNTCSFQAQGDLIVNNRFDNKGTVQASGRTTVNGGGIMNLFPGSIWTTANLTVNGNIQGDANFCGRVSISQETRLNGGSMVTGKVDLCDANGIEVNYGTLGSGVTSNCSCTGNSTSCTFTWQEVNSQGQVIRTLAGTGNSMTGLVAGIYKVSSNCAGCSTISPVTFTISEPATVLTASLSVANPTIPNGCDGSITVTATGGTTPYSFKWQDNNSTANPRTGLCAGSYTVELTDSKGCKINQTGQVNNPCQLTVTTINANCNGQNTGSASVNVNGISNNSSCSFIWQEINSQGEVIRTLSSTTSSVNELIAGGYQVSASCTTCTGSSPVNFTITQPPPLTAVATGQADGSVTLTVSGGTSPYTYQWVHNGVLVSTQQNPANLPLGTNTVTVTDSKGCTTQTTVEVVNNCTPVVSVSNISCFGKGDGKITVTSEPCTNAVISWPGLGVTGPTVSNLGAGTYTLSITCGSCTYTNAYTITEPAVLTASAIANADGSVNLLVTGGTPPYIYQWFHNGTAVSSEASPTNLPQGLNTVIVVDSKSCIIETSVDVPEPECSSGDPTVVIKDETCAGAKDGRIEVSDTTCSGDGEGGNKCFTGPAVPPVADCTGCTAYTQNTIITNGQQFCITDNYTGTIQMSGGRLIVCGTVNATGVTLSGNAEIIILGSFQGSNINFNSSSAHVANYGTVQISGSEPIGGIFDNYGTVTVSGDWNINSGGSLIAFNNYGTLQVGGSLNNGKNFNNYGTINVTNHFQQNSGGMFHNYCTMIVHGNILINAGVHNEGKLLNNFSGSVTTINGSGVLAMEGGLLETTLLQVNGSISGITSDCSLLRYESVVVNGGGSIGNTVESCAFGSTCSCATAGNGIGGGTSSGGNSGGPVTYSWEGPGVNGKTGPVIDHLGPGDYTVTIKCKDCIKKRTYTVKTLPPISIVMTGTPISCDEAFDGSITAQVTGGSGSYTYEWSDGFKIVGTSSQLTNLVAGVYTLTVKDQANSFCSATENFTLSLKGQSCPCSGNLDLHVQGQGPTCHGLSNGFIEVVVKGGVAPYTYLWNTGATTRKVNNLPAGWYSVTVKDALGDSCRRRGFMPEPTGFSVQIQANKTTVCLGGVENIILQAVSGASVSYVWSPGGVTGSIFITTSAGTYTVTGTNAQGCQSAASVTISSNSTCIICETIEVSVTPTNISCYGLRDGKADVSVSGGSGDFSYAWSNGSSSKNLRNAGPGSYSVTVTDNQTGEICSRTITIEEPALLQISIAGGTILCQQGSLTLTATGSTGTYRWIGRSETSQSITITQEGIYQVEVRSGTCTALSNPVTVVKQPTSVSIFTNRGKLCPGDTVVLVSSFPEGNVWSTGATTRSILVGQAGTYSLTVQLGSCSGVFASIVIEAAPAELCKADRCEPQFSIPVDIGNPCAQMELDLARHNARVRYTRYLEEEKKGFQQRYIAKCIQAQENFTLQYSEREHQYTLYYYDQAGNLVSTVPPQGVKVITDAAKLAQIRSDRKNNLRSVETEHDYLTTHSYNTNNQPITQKLPDHGTQQNDKTSSRFWYDELGRVVLSQNARQFNQSPPGYSYTLYDKLNRVFESGEVKSNINLDTIVNTDNGTQVKTTKFRSWLAGEIKNDVTSTYYDTAVFTGIGIDQENLRNRVASNTYQIVDSDGSNITYDHGTHYSYDIHGHVKTLIQDNPTLGDLSGQRYKQIDYIYDLISQNVLEMHYQKGKTDQFFHRNSYDANNRLLEVLTSSDYEHWDREAKQFYYDHGLLARVELGQEKVQGIDYAYTIHDWIKGVNSNTLKANRDMGKDGNTSGLNKFIPQDEISYSLGYYTGDYSAISNPSVSNHFLTDLSGSELESVNKNLFNGNVSHMITGVKQFMQNNEGPLAMSFRYDQLNRLKQSYVYQDNTISSTNDWANSGTASDQYSMKLAYDANGNITTLKRNAQASTTSSSDGLDDLNYIYENKANGYSTNTNKLVAVQDARNHTGNASLAGIDDIEPGQTFNAGDRSQDNYQYDAEGRLIADLSEGIISIKWNNSGKVTQVVRADTSHAADLEFSYDAMGRRIMKLVKPRTGTGLMDESHWTYSYYILNAQGNVIAINERRYSKSASTPDSYSEIHSVVEQHIYGSDKLGYQKPKASELFFRNFTATLNANGRFENIEEQGSLPPPLDNTLSVIRGNKLYELQNHLNNVLAVISDRRIPVNSGQLVIGYTSELLSATDYYPFGMALPGRSFNSTIYRYGFNGMEKDNELKGNNNSYDFGARIYDSRLGRFLSIDRFTGSYPELTPYQFAANNPIRIIDDGGDSLRITANAKESKKFVSMIQKELGMNIKVKITNNALLLTGDASKLTGRSKRFYDYISRVANDSKEETKVILIGKSDAQKRGSTILGQYPRIDRDHEIKLEEGGIQGVTVKNPGPQEIDLYDLEFFDKEKVVTSGIILIHELYEAYLHQRKKNPESFHHSAHPKAIKAQEDITGTANFQLMSGGLRQLTGTGTIAYYYTVGQQQYRVNVTINKGNVTQVNTIKYTPPKNQK